MSNFDFELDLFGLIPIPEHLQNPKAKVRVRIVYSYPSHTSIGPVVDELFDEESVIAHIGNVSGSISSCDIIGRLFDYDGILAVA